MPQPAQGPQDTNSTIQTPQSAPTSVASPSPGAVVNGESNSGGSGPAGGSSLGEVNGISSWVSHYLDSKKSDNSDSVNSDTNAGVSNIDERSNAGAEQQDVSSQRNLSSLRGPWPILAFTILALGGIWAVLSRTSKSRSADQNDR
ncbi:hypothetical protein [Kocuria massiliensis]|uniref:hypothetical protein n=1 Tax=Kocuria massiliensis TaxID=1926282 RepID=UPI000A1CCE88|nr:hypothetical protein [Kocuria massiliensis]